MMTTNISWDILVRYWQDKAPLLAVLMAVLCSHVHAETCEDVTIWNKSLVKNGQQLNSPGATKSLGSDTFAIKAEKDKMKLFLACDIHKIPTENAPVPENASEFKKLVIQELHNSPGRVDAITKAIYLHENVLSRINLITIGTDEVKEWRKYQAKLWCADNDTDEGAAVPDKLPTLRDGVEKLDDKAIALAWHLASRSSTDVLLRSCDQVVKDFWK